MTMKKATTVFALTLTLIWVLIFSSTALGQGTTSPVPDNPTSDGMSLLTPTQPGYDSQSEYLQATSVPGMGAMGGMGTMGGTGSMGAMGDMSTMNMGSACPMMSGGMTGSTSMSGSGSMSGIDSMSGSGSMMGNGMTGMTMPGMQSMAPMAGTSPQQMNDLYGFSINRVNPWWLVGWFVLFLLVLGLIVVSAAGAGWLFTRSKYKPAVPSNPVGDSDTVNNSEITS
jgi:hypothetical protein